MANSQRKIALLAVTGDKKWNAAHEQADGQDAFKHKHTHNQFASLWIALCSALRCVCLGPPAHFGTAAKREGEKRRRWGVSRVGGGVKTQKEEGRDMLWRERPGEQRGETGGEEKS